MEIAAAVRFPTSTDLGPDPDPQIVSDLADLYTDMDRYDVQPLWTQNKALLTKDPHPSAMPWLWRRSRLVPLAERSHDLVTISRGGDRRVLAMANPGLGGRPFATSTLWAAVQYLGGRERAPGHRHTPGAVRFVMEGEGTFTTVDGDACDMSAGDLILTPPWQWHDHQNNSDQPMLWFDGLDLPLVAHLDAIFFEPYPVEDMQPVRGHNLSEGVFGGRGILPAGVAAPDSPAYSPLLVYRWPDTARQLAAMAALSAEPMVTAEYVNPLTGASVLPTIGCFAHLLAPGRRTPTHRTVGSSVFVVFRGRGYSVIDGLRFDWQDGDIFVVPSWAAVDHCGETESQLFSVTDAPVVKALGLHRDRTEESAQQITGIFDSHPAPAR